MVERLIEKLTLAAGSWERLGGNDQQLEQQFAGLLLELQETASVSREEALRMVMGEVD